MENQADRVISSLSHRPIAMQERGSAWRPGWLCIGQRKRNLEIRLRTDSFFEGGAFLICCPDSLSELQVSRVGVRVGGRGD